MGRTPDSRTISAGIALLCAIWGSTWLVIREGLVDLPPFLSLAARLALAGAGFLLLVPLLGRREGGLPPTLGLSLVHGLFVMAVPYGIIYWGEQTLPSGLAAVLWSTYPLFLGLAAHALLPDERLAPRQWLGLLLGLCGVALMFATELSSTGPSAVRAGLLFLASPAISALGNCVLKRRAGGTSSLRLNRNGMIVAALAIGALAWSSEDAAGVRWSARAVGSVLYLALIGTVLTFGLYFWLLRHAPATRLSLVALCTPVFAVALGALVAGESLRPATFAGMACVFTGVGLVVTGKRRRVVSA